jgi:hypothetical protein
VKLVNILVSVGESIALVRLLPVIRIALAARRIAPVRRIRKGGGVRPQKNAKPCAKNATRKRRKRRKIGFRNEKKRRLAGAPKTLMKKRLRAEKPNVKNVGKNEKKRRQFGKRNMKSATRKRKPGQLR